MEFKNHTFNPVDRAIEIAGERYSYRAGALKAGRWERIQAGLEERMRSEGTLGVIEGKVEQIRLFLPEVPEAVFEDLDLEGLTVLSYRLYLEACGIPEAEMEETLKKTVTMNREMRRKLEEAMTSASSSSSLSSGDTGRLATTIGERSGVGSSGPCTSKTTEDSGTSTSAVGPGAPQNAEKS